MLYRRLAEEWGVAVSWDECLVYGQSVKNWPAFADSAAQWGIAQPSRALEATWQLIRATNAHLETNEPWKSEPGSAVDAVMGDALEALRIIAILASPAMPETAQAIWERIGMSGNVIDQRLPGAAAWGQYEPGSTVTKGDALFPRIKL